MSTKIYNGVRIHTPIEKLIPKLCEFREALLPIALDKTNKAILWSMTEAAFLLAGHNKTDGLMPKNEAQKSLNVRTENDFWFWAVKNAHAWTKWDEQTEVAIEVNEKFYVELTLSLFPDPDGEYTYVIPFGSQDLIEAFLKLDGVEDFSYWNNSDEPENISPEEWERRGEVWNRILVSGVPAKDGYTYTVLNSTRVCCPIPTEAELDSFLENNWKNFLKRHIMDGLINRNMEEVFSSQPDCGPFSAYEQAVACSKEDLKNNSKDAWDLRQAYSVVPYTAKALIEFVVDLVTKSTIGLTREERAVVLAAELDLFSFDFDPYDYKDRAEDPEENVKEITKDILSGKISSYLALLEEAAEKGIPKAVELHEKIRKF